MFFFFCFLMFYINPIYVFTQYVLFVENDRLTWNSHTFIFFNSTSENPKYSRTKNYTHTHEYFNFREIICINKWLEFLWYKISIRFRVSWMGYRETYTLGKLFRNFYVRNIEKRLRSWYVTFRTTTIHWTLMEKIKNV